LRESEGFYWINAEINLKFKLNPVTEAMNSIENWNINLEQIGISDPHTLGFAYLTGSVSKVLSVINNKPQEITPLMPLLQENSKLPLSSEVIRELGTDIFIELLFAGKSNDEEKLIQIPDRFQNISFLNSTNKYFYAESNCWTINCAYRDLIKSIGEKIQGKLTKEQALVLGYLHAEMTLKNEAEQKAYIGAVILSNIQPTYLANVMNTFPLPGEFCSSPDRWVFSKEIYSRLSDQKYSLDVEAQNWVMRFHDFLFFENAKDPEENRNKHDSIDILNKMMPNIYTQISKFNDRDPLNSKKVKFSSKYSGQAHWKEFLRDWEDNYAADFGAFKVDPLYCIGEFYSHFSYRFIHAVLLFLEKKKRFGIF
jgi:hypothetical protein